MTDTKIKREEEESTVFADANETHWRQQVEPGGGSLGAERGAAGHPFAARGTPAGSRSGSASRRACTCAPSSEMPPPVPFPISLSSMCSQGYIPFPSLQEMGVLLCSALRGSRCGQPDAAGREGTKLKTKGGSNCKLRMATAHTPFRAGFPGVSKPTASYDIKELFSEETKWPQIKMLTRSAIRVLFNQKAEGWQPGGTAGAVHSGGLTGTYGASDELKVLLSNVKVEPKSTVCKDITLKTQTNKEGDENKSKRVS